MAVQTHSALAMFHPACQHWLHSEFAAPTPAQAQAWPAIKAGRHTLISAPTGSGKTLAAFYAAIDSLVQRGLKRQLDDGVQILYVSPLKALGNDIQKNLERPLDGIAEQLHLCGEPPVDIRVAVRTGDTPASERQKMAKKPPHILVTTPESLYLLLTSASGRAMLASVSTLIVDEIHALLGDKRGAHLALSIARLQRLTLAHSGQFLQRIGLSATQKPITTVARYLVGSDPGVATTDPSGPDCEIVDTGFRRAIDISIEVPASPLSALMSNEVWDELYQRLVELINSHATTLVFVNTRRLSERLALALAERLGENAVCSHHGSMSKDHRFAAEQKLKAGNLKVLVATASMELGIDIGAVDLVVQFSSPKSIATFLQRVGRSGHTLHGRPKGILFPLTRDDLVEAAALLHSIGQGELDRIVMPEAPMDILAQQIVAEVSSQALSQPQQGYDLQGLYQLMRSAYPYRELPFAEFLSLIRMLADGYTTRRGRRGAHLHFDAINQRVRARRGANLVALTNGGAIPDMFDYAVVLDPEDLVVGSLNEDFALEALPGDVFTLGTHSWQLLRVDGLKVRVRDAQGMSPTIPFWFGEGPGRTHELSIAVSNLRETIAGLLINESTNAATRWLTDNVNMPPAGAAQLVDYLQTGMNALGVMPTRETLVMERFFDEVGDMHVVIHSPFGSRINRAWGLALRKRFCRSFNFELQAAANEDSIVISLGSVHSFPLEDVFRYLQSATVKDVLVQALLDAPMFEVRWRWNATRSLAIQRNRSGRRVPPQFQRMDAEDLVAHVFPDQIACQENLVGKRQIPEHPLVQQTIHDCLTEAMDIDALIELLGAIERQQLTLVARDLREPSPFAQEIINARPYAFLDDAPFEERRTNAIRHRSWTDPAETKDYSLLDSEAIQRVQQEAWPYVRNAEELHDALMSVAYITAAEFSRHNYAAYVENLQTQNRIIWLDSIAEGIWIATEQLPCFKAVFKQVKVEAVLPEFLQQQNWQAETALKEIVKCRMEALGPITARHLATELALPGQQINAALIALEVDGYAVQGQFLPGACEPGQSAPEVQWCERRLLQRIHRYTIDAHRKSIKPVSLAAYTEFLFDLHELQPLPVTAGEPALLPPQPGLDGQTQLQSSLNRLDGIAAPAGSWEANLYPLRVKNYDPAWLDVMCISGRVCWGRYSVPTSAAGSLSRRAGAPVKSTPVVIASRTNLDIWLALARAQQQAAQALNYGAEAATIVADLQQHGASFFDQIQTRTGLLKSQLESGLAELVSSGRLTSDSFTGLRALLTPNRKKPGAHRRRGRKAMFGVEDAGRWSLLDTFQEEQIHTGQRAASAAPRGNKSGHKGRNGWHWETLSDTQLERLISIYLQRWGVVFRAVLERETFAPPWRILLAALRKMELRGELRGGRFIAGVGGEQFAFNATVDALRQFSNRPTPNKPWYSLSAVDPLNLMHLLSPARKLSRLAKNRVLYQGGVPVAVLDAGAVEFLREVDTDEQWPLQQALLQQTFPPRLRSYLGTR